MAWEDENLIKRGSNSDSKIESDQPEENVQLMLLRELKKETVGETYKHVNKLIKQNHFQNCENIKILVASNQSLPLFEESLRLILIDGLRLKDEVIKILLGQDDYQAHRILKCKWFFKNALPAEYYIQNIFPFLSTSVRFKVLNRLSKYLENEEEAEKIFQYFYTNWSCKLAEILLPKCGVSFIINYITKVKLRCQSTFKNRSLINIIRRYPETTEPLFFELFSNDAHQLYLFKKLFVYVASHYPSIFVDMLVKYHSKISQLYLTFGKKLSRRVGMQIKDSILKSSEVFKSHFLSQEHFFGVLCQEDQVQYIAALIRFANKKLSLNSWTHSESIISTLLKTVSPERRVFVVQSAFKEVFHEDFKDYPKLWSPDILELFPVKQRLLYVEKLQKYLTENQSHENQHFDLSKQPEEFFYLNDFTVGFEKLKKIVSKEASVLRRQAVLQFMVKNCAINKDIKALQEVVNFIGTRHRNDQPRVILEFVNTVLEYFPTSKLDLENLEKLEELLYFCSIRGDSYFNRNQYASVAEMNILRRLDKNMNADIQLNNFFNLVIIRARYAQCFLENVKSKHFRFLFFELSKRMCQWIEDHKTNGENDISEVLFISILRTCARYNQFHKQNPILLSGLPELKPVLELQLEKIHGDVGGKEWELDIWQRYYCDVNNSYFQPKCMLYMLKHKPEMVLKNITKIIDHFTESYGPENINFLRRSQKTFFFYGVMDFVKKTLLTTFTCKNSIYKKHAIELFSYVSNPEEFEEAIVDYIPKKEQIDKSADTEFSEIQLKIPKLLQNLRPQSKVVNLTLKFFFGDFLKNVLPSFRVSCYCIQVYRILPFLKSHLEKLPNQISYKKDVIKLIAELSSREEELHFCLSYWNTNAHYSIRTILFRFVSKNFLEFPTQSGFQALKKCIQESDELVILAKPQLNQIPDDYFNDYICALWVFSENQKQSFRNDFRNAILNSLQIKHIKLLSKEFCEAVITENLFQHKPALRVEKFTVDYLASDLGLLKPKTLMVMSLLRTALSEISSIVMFLHCLEKTSLTNTSSLGKVFEIILQKWPEEAPKEWLFEERIVLNYYDFYHKSLKMVESSKCAALAVEFGKKLKNFCTSFKNLSDFLVILIDSLNHFFQNLEDFETILVVKELIEGSSDKSVIVLGLSVLPDSTINLFLSDSQEDFSSVDYSRREYLEEIISSIKHLNDEVVNIYFRRKFNFKNGEL